MGFNAPKALPLILIAAARRYGHFYHYIFGIGTGGFDGKALVAWALVGIPLLWGVWVTIKSTYALFG